MWQNNSKGRFISTCISPTVELIFMLEASLETKITISVHWYRYPEPFHPCVGLDSRQLVCVCVSLIKRFRNRAISRTVDTKTHHTLSISLRNGQCMMEIAGDSRRCEIYILLNKMQRRLSLQTKSLSVWWLSQTSLHTMDHLFS